MGVVKLHKPIIIGIDPGTTSGYAILDSEGRLLRVRSAKWLGLDTMIAEISSYGTAIAVGTDKKNCPAMVQRFAAKTGARIISPVEDLGTREKAELVKGSACRNSHEKDALASALSAHRELHALLVKIDKSLMHNGLAELKDDVVRIVVSQKKSINSAIEFLLKKDEPENIAISRHEEEKKPEDSLIVDKLKRMENVNAILRKHNIKLLKALRKSKSKCRKMAGKFLEKRIPDQKASDSLWEQIRAYKRKVSSLQEQLSMSNMMLSNLKEKVVMKKLGNLTWDELCRKGPKLDIKEGDILLVDNPKKQKTNILLSVIEGYRKERQG